MGNEDQAWLNSIKPLNASSEVETIKVKVKPQPVCTAIFIPETGELVGLTSSEYMKLVDDADEFDTYIKAVTACLKSENALTIATAKQELATFIANKQSQKSTTTPPPGVVSLTKINNSSFIEVIELGAAKHSFLLRSIVDSFRHPQKTAQITQPGSTSDNRDSDLQSLATVKAEKSAKWIQENSSLPPLRTENGQINSERIRKQFLDDIKGKITWNLVDPKSGQLPSKYLARLILGPAGKLLEQNDI